MDSTVKPQVNDNGNSIEDMDFEVDAPELNKLIKILPDVLGELKRAGKDEVYKKFCQLVAENKFPTSNIAFLLFLDVVNWFSTSNTSGLRFQYSELVFNY